MKRYMIVITLFCGWYLSAMQVPGAPQEKKSFAGDDRSAIFFQREEPETFVTEPILPVGQRRSRSCTPVEEMAQRYEKEVVFCTLLCLYHMMIADAQDMRCTGKICLRFLYDKTRDAYASTFSHIYNGLIELGLFERNGVLKKMVAEQIRSLVCVESADTKFTVRIMPSGISVMSTFDPLLYGSIRNRVYDVFGRKSR